MALLKFLIPTFFIVYSLGEIARINLFSSVNSGILDGVILLIILAWAFFLKKSKYSLKIPILLFFALALLSLVINITRFSQIELLISSLYLIRFILYAGLYFVFVDLDKNLTNKIPKYMFLSGILFLILGLIQYFFYSDLRKLYSFGWDDHMHRLVSTYIDPNFAGVFLVLFLVFVFIMKDRIFSKKYFWAYYLTIILNLIAIVLTFSRGALLMLLVCVVTYSFLTRNWKISAGLLVGFVIVFFVLSPKFYVENMNLLRFASTEARLESSRMALSIWRENPMGVGFNTYRFARKEYEKTDWTPFGPSHAGSGVDNSFISILTTAGFLGLMTYIYLLFRIFKLGFSNIKKNKMGLVLVVSLAGLVANSMFINSLFYGFLMIWIFILAGLTENTSRE